jgi:hypothetical protein
MKQLLAGISSADAAETAAACLREGDAARVAALLDEALARAGVMPPARGQQGP